MLVGGRRARKRERGGEKESGAQNEKEGVSRKRFMNGRHVVKASDSCECQCDNMRMFFSAAPEN